MPPHPDPSSPASLFERARRRLSRERRPDYLSVFPGPLRLSGPKLLSEIGLASHLLKAHGLRPGSRVLVSLVHPLAVLLAVPALWSLDCVPLLREGGSSGIGLGEIASVFSPDAILEEAADGDAGGQSVLLPPLPLLRLHARARTARPRLPPGTVLVRATSGSTGTPRGVAVSASQLLADAANISRSLRLTPRRRALGAVPLTHAFGFSTLLSRHLFLGAPLVLLERPLPGLFRAALGRYRDLFFPGIPFLYDLLLEAGISPRLLARLSVCVSAGAPLRRETADRFRARTGVPVRNFYGTSECGAIAADRSAAGDAPEGCAGAPLQGVTVAFEDCEDPASEAGGRIVVRGKAVALGYVASGARYQGFRGRFATGDRGRLDRKGRLFLEGRLDTMINVGGVKIFPSEVERVLSAAPGVREAAVFGVPDSLRGESVAAAVAGGVSLKLSDLTAFCRGHLAAHRLPRRILLLPSLPRTPRGKVDLAALKKLAADPEAVRGADPER